MPIDGIPPLPQGMPIVNPDGSASSAFAQWWQQMFGNTEVLEGDIAGKADKTTSIIAGDGLTGGGTLAADRTLNVGAGTGISVGADAVSLNADIDDLNDVDTTSTPPTDGQALVWVDANSMWEPGDVASGGGGGGGAWEWLASYDETGVSSIDIEDFAGDTDVLAVEIYVEEIAPSVDGGGINALMKLNGAYKTADYKWSGYYVFTTTPSPRGSASDSKIEFIFAGAGGIGSAADEGGSGKITIHNPNGALPKKLNFQHFLIDNQGTPRSVSAVGGGSYRGTDYASALGGLRLQTSSGTMSIKAHVFVLKATASGGGGGTTYERARSVPAASDFTLQNANSGTITDGSDSTGILFDSVNSTAGIRMIRRNGAPPATPYTIITRSQPIWATGAGYPTGIVLRNSGTGRIIIFGTFNYNSILVQNWSAYGSFAGNVLGGTVVWVPGAPVWMQVENDGTNLNFSISPDGNNWRQMATTTLAAYISSADEIGMGVYVSGSTMKSMFQSWEVA